MEYSQILKRLFAQKRTGQGRSLAPAKALDKLTGQAHKSYPVIHVAGTNGKGGLCYQLAHCLEAAGYKVGLFTSPHVECACERIQINRKNIAKEVFASRIEALLNLIDKEGVEAGFFDLLTFAAFTYFKAEGVDVAIIETGLGGTFDSTNVVEPILTAITSIGLDHMPILGHTLEAIAKEKGGIIKPRCPVILGSSAKLAPILERAQEQEAPILQVNAASPTEEREAMVKLSLPILKEHGLVISEQALTKGVSRLIPFRNEWIGPWLLDGAHNGAALKVLLSTFPYKPVQMVLGVGRDKNEEALVEIAKHVGACHIWPTSHERLMPPETLQTYLQALGVKAYTYKTSKQCLIAAYKASNYQGCVVAGSYYILSEVKAHLMRAVAPPR